MLYTDKELDSLNKFYKRYNQNFKNIENDISCKSCIFSNYKINPPECRKTIKCNHFSEYIKMINSN